MLGYSARWCGFDPRGDHNYNTGIQPSKGHLSPSGDLCELICTSWQVMTIICECDAPFLNGVEGTIGTDKALYNLKRRHYIYISILSMCTVKLDHTFSIMYLSREKMFD